MSTKTTRTGKPCDLEILDTIVHTLIEEHTIMASDLTREWDGRVVPANEGWSGKVEQIALAKAKELSAEILSRIIVAEPDAELYNVHCGTWLGKYESGPYLLQQIAATAIVCRIRARLGVSDGISYHADRAGNAA